MIPIAALLLLAVPALQTGTVQVVHRPAPGERVAFVHVASEAPELVLGIYSDDRLMAVWPHSAGISESVVLGPGERFVLDDMQRILAHLHFGFPCLDRASVSGVAQFTELRFPRPILPELPPIPQPNPPPPVDGANTVHVSADGELVVFVRALASAEAPTIVRVFRLPEPSAVSYALTGTYVNRGQGELRTSLGGKLIAQREGRDVRLMLFDGVELARLRLEGHFDLAPDARWLARTTSARAVYDELDANGQPTGNQVSLPTISEPIGIEMLADGLSLVHERSTVTLFDADARQPLWSRTTTQGIYVSTALVDLGAGRVLVGLGRRELWRAPARKLGKFVPGDARAHVETIDTTTDELLFQTTFAMTTWDAGVPQVRFVGAPPRLLVTSPESAVISQPVQ